MSASDVTTSNTDFWSQAEKAYNDVTTSRPWRHTVGRISCLARIPIYAIALGLQTAKIAAKTLISPITYLVAWMFNTKKLDSFKFEGIGKDCLTAIRLLDRIGGSALGVIFAPPKKYFSFWESIKCSGSIVAGIKYHELDIHALALGILNARASYYKCIIQTDKIFDYSLNNAAKGVTSKVLEKVHAC